MDGLGGWVDKWMDAWMGVSVQESKEKVSPLTSRLAVYQVVEDTGKYPGLS